MAGIGIVSCCTIAPYDLEKEPEGNALASNQYVPAVLGVTVIVGVVLPLLHLKLLFELLFELSITLSPLHKVRLWLAIKVYISGE